MKLSRVILRDPLIDLGGSKVIVANDDTQLDYEAGMVTVTRPRREEDSWLIPMGNVSGMRVARVEKAKK